MSTSSPSNWGISASRAASATSPEKSASSHVSPASQAQPPPTTAPNQRKLRSCVTCRTRKVRCDKTSPCSNCRRANIPCVVPSTEKLPRWARRLERATTRAESDDPATGQVFNRLKSLEGLVRELGGQLERVQAGGASSGVVAKDVEPREARVSDESTANLSTAQKQFGRLVIGDTGQSRYVDSGFWSRINDELNGLKMDTEVLHDDYESSDDEDMTSKDTPSTQELDRDPAERNAFMFGHNLDSRAVDLRRLHPLPSQLPFILNIFHTSINSMGQVVHMPTLNKMIRDLPSGDLSALSPPNEALLFAIYYSSITSMEDEDVTISFGSSKSDLMVKYRHGLELALAKADFLNTSDIAIVQALVISLMLVRRHDSPRYVWMMTGLLIRMAQALGLHRDGSNFPHLTPFEVETRRRLWWIVCVMDLRSSEDQGMDLTITDASFDTKFPLSINDDDLHPDTKDMPKEREGLTDMTVPLVWYNHCHAMRQMYVMLTGKSGPQTLEKQSRLLDEIYGKLEERYLRYSNPDGNAQYLMFIGVTRIVVSKMTLVIYLPELFSSPTERFSDEVHTKLLVAAIEIAEFNHMLNGSKACQPWRWIFQTYTHWHAIVYLLLTAAQKPWSPTVERGWAALHSKWLIPARRSKDWNLRTWVPLRKLMTKAKQHREAEMERLRMDHQAARELEEKDRGFPQPVSSGVFQGQGDVAEMFRVQWRQLVGLQVGYGSNLTSEEADSADKGGSRAVLGSEGTVETGGISHEMGRNVGQNMGLSYDMDSFAPASEGTSGQTFGQDFSSWQWEESGILGNFPTGVDMEGVDFDVELDAAMDWNKWLQDVQ